MSIYKDLLDAVDNGKKFKVDLVNKSLWINKKQIIKEGEIVHDEDKSKDLIKEWDLALNFGSMPLDEYPFGVIEFLYNKYKHSAPREHSNKKSYFKALSVDELTDGDLAYGYDRDFAQAMLEGYILLGSIVGWIKWENDNHWFYQGKDKELIILKEWI
jgi:hypothetical protein